MFPLFASRFLREGEEFPRGEVVPSKHSPGHLGVAPAAGAKPIALRALDLQTLPRDNGPPTELRTRKEKLAHYEQECSHVGDRLFVGGELVAKSLDVLQAANITHIINCVGFLYPPYFESTFGYQTLYLQDTPGEDILSVLYDVFDYIDSAPEGRIFIHCSQGVSRSTTLAIAYRMWKEGRAYEDVFAEVKQMRGVANPNIGFICQLLQWHRRRTEDIGVPRLYRIAPQSASAPLYLVPKTATLLDPRGAFVLHAGSELFVWTGENCPEDFKSAALHFTGQLHKYEVAPPTPVMIQQGEETEEFWRSLELVSQSAAKGGCTPTPGPAPGTTLRDVHAVPAYDKDYDLFGRAAIHSPDGLHSPCDSARSGRKTPRTEVPQAASPNDRLRKHARSEAMERERERSARTSRSSGGSGSFSGSYGLGSESARNRALDYQELAVRRRATALPPGRPPFTPRGAATNEATPSPRNPLGTSRLGVPKLRLSNLGASGGGASSARGPPSTVRSHAGHASARHPSSHTTASTLASDDDDDDDDENDADDTSDSEHSDDSTGYESTPREDDDRPANAAAAARMLPAVPRLNLGK